MGDTQLYGSSVSNQNQNVFDVATRGVSRRGGCQRLKEPMLGKTGETETRLIFFFLMDDETTVMHTGKEQLNK